MSEAEIRQDERSRVLGEVAARLFAKARDRDSAAALAGDEADEEYRTVYLGEARALRSFAETMCRERTGPRGSCGHLSLWQADVGLCAHPDCRHRRGEAGTTPPAVEELVRRCIEAMPIRTSLEAAQVVVDAIRDAWALGRGEIVPPVPAAPAPTAPLVEAEGSRW